MDEPKNITFKTDRYWIHAILLCLACVSFWILVIPYCAGHGDGRERIVTWLLRHWSTSTWFHGAVVPFFAVVMAWTLREKLSRQRCSPHWAGIVILVLAFLFLWAGYRTHVVYFGLAGVQMLFAGFILWQFGAAHFRILFFPFCFLALTWPLPFLEASLSFHLRIWMTEMCAGLINIFGGEVSRQGTALVWGTETGSVHMEIEGACSGLRSLFSLFAAACLFGFFALRRTSDRLVLLAMAIPLAVLGNIARIILLYIGVHIWDWETAIGVSGSPSTFHIFAGILAIGVGLGGIIFSAALLRRRGRKKIYTRMSGGKRQPEASSPSPQGIPL